MGEPAVIFPVLQINGRYKSKVLFSQVESLFNNLVLPSCGFSYLINMSATQIWDVDVSTSLLRVNPSLYIVVFAYCNVSCTVLSQSFSVCLPSLTCFVFSNYCYLAYPFACFWPIVYEVWLDFWLVILGFCFLPLSICLFGLPFCYQTVTLTILWIFRIVSYSPVHEHLPETCLSLPFLFSGVWPLPAWPAVLKMQATSSCSRPPNLNPCRWIEPFFCSRKTETSDWETMSLL